MTLRESSDFYFLAQKTRQGTRQTFSK
ncbi:hypothetical protein CNECB9_1100028 [Cupriavidus necator]|uniref:Uncharacterized protein n=1 Tax=Cupriavidus necator TaxID=106590 RepID=A0A1K0I844_CUPNE|nr:hypothetical protein CNECB9_1100028 [Cupriavidus necator]